MKWLEQQPDTSNQPESGDASALNLLEALQVKHIVSKTEGNFILTFFAVSQQSGSIGINSMKGKPALSIMYPGTNKPLLTLSRYHRYTSVLFTTISDQEYLAASSRDSIHLWNPEKNTSSVVYEFKEQKNWHLCAVDERTVVCAEDQHSSDEFIQISMLKIDAEMWTLSSTHSVKVNHSAYEISYAKTTDGTACLLLSSILGCHVQLVEIVGGKVRWQVGQQEMGRSFCPGSICSDSSTAFVADFIQHHLHLLSVDDGSVLRSIILHPLGIYYPSCVRLQGERLYIGHVNEKHETYYISKFIKPTDV